MTRLVKDPALLELLESVKDWSPKAKAKALESYRQRISGERRVWYCATPGRLCDGKPHEGYPYPHARADQWPPPPKIYCVVPPGEEPEVMHGFESLTEAREVAKQVGGKVMRDSWFVFAMRGGRGSGKTRSGAEYTRAMTKHVSRIALIAPTNADVRDTMIEGESGLEAVFASVGERIHYEPSKRRVTFPNGCRAGIFSGEEPDRLRGPQHGFGWLDEPAHIPAIDSVWSNFLFGLRLGTDPKVAVTTTPTPKPWMKKLVKDPRTISRQVSTYANLANLAQTYQDNVIKQYEGTRLGRQELDGEILNDVEGALWNGEIITYDLDVKWEDCERIVVAIDPAGVVNKRADDTGIIVVGRIGDKAYVFADRTGKYSPTKWAQTAVSAYHAYHADAIVAEKNYGGEMVQTVIDNERSGARVIVVTATRGKQLRAEPIVGLYEQGRVKHAGERGMLGKLEDEMLGWVPGEGASPNRVDALVWAVTELMQINSQVQLARPPSGRRLPPPGGGFKGMGKPPWRN